MNTKYMLTFAAGTLIAAGVAYAQFPIMDKVADKVIQKYQTSSCQQLWQEKAARTGPAEAGDGTARGQDAAIGSADAPGILRQGLGADREQDVRMRNDPVTLTPGART